MKRKHNEGFTLVELLVSIAILSAIVLPTCTSLVMSYRLNAKAEQMMQAQLAVSSAVETLMAEGIDAARAETLLGNEVDEYDSAWDSTRNAVSETDDYPHVTIKIDKSGSTSDYYTITVTDDNQLVTVTTCVRIAKGGSQP